MKILIVANNDSGLYGFRKELILKICKHHEVYYTCPKGEYIEKINSLGGIYMESNIDRHSKNIFKELVLIKSYKQIIKKVKPDVVLTYTIKPNIYAGLICKKLKIPYICNITGLGMALENKSIIQKFLIKLYKKSLKNAYKVFVQNEGNLQFLLDKKMLNNNYEVLPGSGVNLEEYKYTEYPKEDCRIEFVTIGRIMKDKGILEILSAAETIKQKNKNIVFKLIGRFDDDFCKKIVKDACEKGIIEYIEYSNNVRGILAKSNAIIHASYHEGMSNVLLEAGACGRPIIASNIHGCKETFIEGQSGISFEIKNVDSLVVAIETFLDLPYHKKKEMGINARNHIEKNFDREIIINKYNEILNILEKRG